MSEPLARFQELLHELFQLNCADLDFGIYRILNAKRAQVEDLICNRLPALIDQALVDYTAAERQSAEAEVQRLREQVLQTFGLSVLDSAGHPRPDLDYPLLQQYRQALLRAQPFESADEARLRIYNDLYAFFSRYYEEGDFVSKRRLGYDGAYAVPYNGEEVLLHWANRDQYYVKTTERFQSYRFRAGPYTISFALRAVSAESTPNQRRYFVLAAEDPLAWHAETNSLTIFLEYRPLDAAEQVTYGKTEQQRPQERLNERTEETILAQVPDATLRAHLARVEEGPDRSLLARHLARYTRRNSADFFVHKDLGGFLRRELDYFVKTEVLRLDELLGGGEADLRHHLRRAHAFRQVAEAVIAFLSQVEDLQKKLFEKRKFVVRTEYCCTLDRIPEPLWEQVLQNEAQLQEWRELYDLDGLLEHDRTGGPLMHNGLDLEFLHRHPTLVVDTRHFSEAFQLDLLAAFPDLEAALDGVLIKSENWQALRLLQERYRGQVQCIYIDPPYNTGSADFLYKDSYRHSSWLSMMEDRLLLTKDILAQDGVLFVSIDRNELLPLGHLLADCFGAEHYVGDLIWKNATDNNPTRIAVEHEYIVCFAKNAAALPSEWKSSYSEAKQLLLERFNELKKQGLASDVIQKYYREFIRDNAAVIGELERYKFIDAEGPYTGSESVHNPHLGGYDYEILHPVTGKPMRKPASGYRFPYETMKRDYIDKGRLIYGPDENRIVKIKLYLRDYLDSLRSVLMLDGRLGAYSLGALFGATESIFSNPKPVELLKRLVSFVTGVDGWVCDFFAGSGTTAHAVIDFNRQDGGRRKYLLVEMGDYFDTVLLPRIKKVAFCAEWKAGRPTGGAGLSHMLRYHTLEQYDDTLDNLEFSRAPAGQMALQFFEDDYLLHYMLDFETAGSPSLLDLKGLLDPFAYRLRLREGDAVVERAVDLVETFNYLLGLRVRRMRAFQDGGRPYRAVLGEKDGRQVLVVWRPAGDLVADMAALRRDQEFIIDTLAPALLPERTWDRLLVNGPCAVGGAESIEPEFKRLMFAE